jgi:hypothetical protein
MGWPAFEKTGEVSGWGGGEYQKGFTAMNTEEQDTTVLVDIAETSTQNQSAGPVVPELVPDAPIQEPETVPHTPASPPEHEPDLDPFNPAWPEHRPEPQPKA